MNWANVLLRDHKYVPYQGKETTTWYMYYPGGVTFSQKNGSQTRKQCDDRVVVAKKESRDTNVD